MKKLPEIINNLKVRSQKITKIRKLILDLLIKSDSLNDALTIQKRLARLNSKVNKSTIYRELTFLVSQGIIKSVDFGDGKKRYEIDEKDHHHHLICLKCKNIDHFSLEDDLTSEEKLIKKIRNFQVLNHSLEFFGLCQNCQKI